MTGLTCCNVELKIVTAMDAIACTQWPFQCTIGYAINDDSHNKPQKLTLIYLERNMTLVYASTLSPEDEQNTLFETLSKSLQLFSES